MNMNDEKQQYARPIYRLIDGRGRVYIPKELRVAADMDCGNIIKLSLSKGVLCIKRVHIVEIGDKSPEAMEEYVRAAVKQMPKEKQITLAAELMRQIEQSKEA